MIQALLLLRNSAAAALLGRYDMLRSPLTTESGDRDDGAKVAIVDDLGPNGAPLGQATSGNRPVIDGTTVKGLRLLTFDETDHLVVTPGATIRALVLLIHLPSSPAPRDIAAVDTSASTDKPAVIVRLG